MIDRINHIADQLLFKYKSELSGSKALETGISVELITHLIRPLLVEKNYQYKNSPKIKIESNFDESSYGLFARVDRVEFQRVLSNLLNNAFEAIPETGRVSVTLARADNSIHLKVRDDGIGISPADILQVRHKGVTFQKKGGAGLGLAHEKACVKEWLGKLEIESQVGEGTAVIISLPHCPSPAWFLTGLNFVHKQWVTIVDDDPSIFQAWRTRLKDALLEIFYLTSLDDLEAWYVNPKRPAQPTTLLVDYEFEHNRGLNVIDFLKS